MDKTLRIEKVEMLKSIIDNIRDENVSYNIYGTSNEDSYLSGINEGLGRAVDVVQELINQLEDHE